MSFAPGTTNKFFAARDLGVEARIASLQYAGIFSSAQHRPTLQFPPLTGTTA